MKRELLMLVNLLDRYNVKYLIFGGLASILYGTARATFDIDVVVKKDSIPENFIEILEKEGFSAVEGITCRELLESRYAVFVVGGNEVDFWLNVDGFNFDDDSWKHRSDEKVDDVYVHFISMEDLIASKLSITPTENDYIDIFSILVNQTKNLDVSYLSKRIKQFKLEDKLLEVRKKMIELSNDKEIKPNLEEAIKVLNKLIEK